MQHIFSIEVSCLRKRGVMGAAIQPFSPLAYLRVVSIGDLVKHKIATVEADAEALRAYITA